MEYYSRMKQVNSVKIDFKTLLESELGVLINSLGNKTKNDLELKITHEYNNELTFYQADLLIGRYRDAERLAKNHFIAMSKAEAKILIGKWRDDLAKLNAQGFKTAKIYIIKNIPAVKILNYETLENIIEVLQLAYQLAFDE